MAPSSHCSGFLSRRCIIVAIVVWTFHTWMKLMVIESKYRDVSLGASLSPPYQQPWGPREPHHWHPPNSTAPKQRHAIVVPYRNREIHLELFQQFMNAYFHRFFRDIAAFDIWIVEQADDKLFRRSSLVNVGILEAMNYSKNGLGCIVCHDVDLLPDATSLGIVPYHYCPQPIQLGSELEHFNWGIPYREYFGGVVSLSAEHWKLVNGMSNFYRGWGGEDDDLYWRLVRNRFVNATYWWDKETYLSVLRPPHDYGRFLASSQSEAYHSSDKQRAGQNKKGVTSRLKEMKAGKDIWKTDGLNDVNYTIMESEHTLHLDHPSHWSGFASYHHITVNLA